MSLKSTGVSCSLCMQRSMIGCARYGSSEWSASKSGQSEGAGEVVPVACLIQLKKRHDGRIIFVERRPSERKRLERRRLWIGLRLGIGHVERVRYERSVTGHPYVEVNRRGAFDGDRFGDD